MNGTTRLCRAVAPCLLAGVLGACRDLTLPDINDGGVGPDLTVRSSREGQTIPLNAPVDIDAVSVNGVSSVTVTCGGARLERLSLHGRGGLHSLQPRHHGWDRRRIRTAPAHLHRRGPPCSQTFNALTTGACGTNLGCTVP